MRSGQAASARAWSGNAPARTRPDQNARRISPFCGRFFMSAARNESTGPKPRDLFCHRSSRRTPERLARPLLKSGCWGFQRPSLRQAPPGQHISSPAAYFFGIVSGPTSGHGSPAAAGCASHMIGAAASRIGLRDGCRIEPSCSALVAHPLRSLESATDQPIKVDAVFIEEVGELLGGTQLDLGQLR